MTFVVYNCWRREYLAVVPAYILHAANLALLYSYSPMQFFHDDEILSQRYCWLRNLCIRTHTQGVIDLTEKTC